MSRLLSEILFNRALIWLVAAIAADNDVLRVGYGVAAAVNVIKSLAAATEVDADA
jgi:hypothetical protein